MMQEILFENVFTLNEVLSAQIVRMQLGLKRPILLTIAILMELNYIGSAILYLMWGDGYYYLVLSLIWLAFILCLFFQPRITAKLHMRRVRKFHNQAIPENHTMFTKDELIAQNGTSQLKIPYSKLDKVKMSDHLMLLMVKKYAYVTIHKSGFTKGTYEEFLQFLRTQCPDLKIPE